MSEPVSERVLTLPAAAPRPDAPWVVGDLFGVGFGNVVGLGMLLTGLQATRHTTDPHTLLLLLDVAAAGVVVAFAANAVFLLSALRLVGQERTLLLGRRPARQQPAAAPAGQPVDLAGVALVSAPAMTRFHRADCPAVRGKEVTEASLDEHLDAGRRPCGLCGADQPVAP